MRPRSSYRVAMVAACPFPSLRGSQVLVRELAENLAAAGHSVHVVTYPTAQHIVPLQRIAIHRVARLPGLWTTRPLGWQKVVLDLLLMVLLFRVVLRERIDIIHAHNIEAPILAFLVRFLTGVPVIYHAHNALSDELPCYFRLPAAKRVAYWLGGGLDRFVARRADFCIGLSDRLTAFLAMRGATGRVGTIPPGAPAGVGARAAQVSGDGPVIMYAGNLDPYQNLPCLLEGFDRVCAAEPRARLVLVTQQTTDPLRMGHIQELARRPGVTVRTVSTFGSVTRELRRADVLVCPRTSWSGFPIKVLHYMAIGTVVVQSRGSAHVVEDGLSGLLFTDDDPVSLARTVLRALRDPALAMRLGREAQLIAKRDHSWRRLVTRVNAVYDDILDRREGPSERKLGRARDTAKTGRTAKSAMMRSGGVVSEGAERALRRHSLLAGFIALWFAAGCAPRAAAPAPLPPIQVQAVPSPIDWDTDYRLQMGDVLRIKFQFHPELDLKVPVGPDGRIAIQGVGELVAQGKTTQELASDVAATSNDRLRDPVVTVILAQLAERVVYVGGEVRLPGAVVFREGLTPLQAVLDRGGFTEAAQTDSILRLTIKGNSYEATRLDLGRNINLGSGDLSALEVYDVIYVPRSYIGDMNAFVRLYIRGLMPTMPRIGYSIN